MLTLNLLQCIVTHSLPSCPGPDRTGRLKMRDLQLLVVPRVAAQWYELGLELGFRDFRLDTIRSNYGNTEDHSRELFSVWLNGERFSGDRPRTWEVLLDAVKRVVGSEVVDEIECELSKGV